MDAGSVTGGQEKGDGLSAGAIAGIVIGGLAFILIKSGGYDGPVKYLQR